MSAQLKKPNTIRTDTLQTLAHSVGWTLFGVSMIGIAYASSTFAPIWIIGPLLIIILSLVILHQPWNGLLLLVFFLPFERIGSYDVAGTTIRPSQAVAALTLFSCLLLFLSKRRRALPANPTVLPMLAFIGTSVFGLLNAPNLERSILVLVFITFTMCISLVVPFLMKDKQQVAAVLRVFFLSMGIVALFGLYQFAGDSIGLPTSLTGLRELYTKDVLGFPRLQSTALEPLYFANYLLVPLSVLLSLFFMRDTTVVRQRTVIGLLAVGASALVLTVARGGYIAFAASALLLFCYHFRRLLSLRNVLIALAVGIAGAVVALKLIGFQAVTENFLSHVSNIFGGASYSERVETFELAESAFRMHPLIGIGPGSFGPFASSHPYDVPAHGWSIVNNEYLELLAEHGVLGFVSILIIFCILFVRSAKAFTYSRDPFLRAVLAGVLAGFAGILIQYNTFSILYIVHIWFTVGLLVAIQNIMLKRT